MGFFVKDLFVQRVPKFTWRDPLTNPPTIPETSPIIQVAALSPNVAVARRGGWGGAANLPADDNTLFTVPSWLSPIITPGGRLQESDLAVVRETLVTTLKAVDDHIATMQPTAEDLEHLSSVIQALTVEPTSGALARISRAAAVRAAALTGLLEVDQLAAVLYRAGGATVGLRHDSRWATQLTDVARRAAGSGLDPYEVSRTEAWNSWSVRGLDPAGLEHKVYVSPTVAALPRALPIIFARNAELHVPAWKVGAGRTGPVPGRQDRLLLRHAGGRPARRPCAWPGRSAAYQPRGAVQRCARRVRDRLAGPRRRRPQLARHGVRRSCPGARGGAARAGARRPGRAGGRSRSRCLGQRRPRCRRVAPIRSRSGRRMIGVAERRYPAPAGRRDRGGVGRGGLDRPAGQPLAGAADLHRGR